MVDPTFEVGHLGQFVVELGRIVDRGLKESRAIDCAESLYILAGKVVWGLRVNLNILDIVVTFAFFGEGDMVVLDPNYKEEAVIGGKMTFTMNTHRDVCAVEKGSIGTDNWWKNKQFSKDGG
ncbi:hypothetical protein SUGI_0498090 [Cryptomeria japonica]|nr:hypothetical protein SUGI_0498090 [Cryptomeria japonica]